MIFFKILKYEEIHETFFTLKQLNNRKIRKSFHDNNLKIFVSRTNYLIQFTFILYSLNYVAQRVKAQLNSFSHLVSWVEWWVEWRGLQLNSVSVKMSWVFRERTQWQIYTINSIFKKNIWESIWEVKEVNENLFTRYYQNYYHNFLLVSLLVFLFNFLLSSAFYSVQLSTQLNFLLSLTFYSVQLFTREKTRVNRVSNTRSTVIKTVFQTVFQTMF